MCYDTDYQSIVVNLGVYHVVVEMYNHIGDRVECHID